MVASQCVFFSLTHLSSFSTEIYVSMTGSDSNDGMTLETAVATVSQVRGVSPVFFR